jgi:hypothetical protein
VLGQVQVAVDAALGRAQPPLGHVVRGRDLPLDAGLGDHAAVEADLQGDVVAGCGVALNWADDDQVIPPVSLAVAVRMVRAPAGRPCTVTATGWSTSAATGDTEIDAWTLSRSAPRVHPASLRQPRAERPRPGPVLPAKIQRAQP